MKNVLVVAAHPDDEVLGAGGTLARLADEGAEVHLLILSEGETSRHGDRKGAAAGRAVKAREKAARKAAEILGAAGVSFGRFPDQRFDSVDLLELVRRVEAEAERVRPRAVFTHFAGDLNTDHRLTFDAVMAAFRPRPGASGQELYAFEVPSSTGWVGPDVERAFRPTVYVNIAKQLERKLSAMAAYTMEARTFPHARSLEAVEALARWRGAEAGLPAAEAFALLREIRR
jgi:LmbE family N-acetylglucosaminyl deacetylase